MLQNQTNQDKLLYAYWALRGKPHSIRLLMEHLNIPYQDIVFKSPKLWETQGKQIYQDLPCLKDQDIVLHDLKLITTYILKKYNHEDYLGKTVEHKAYVEMYLWSMETLNQKVVSCSVKDTKSVEQLLLQKEILWQKEISKKLKQIMQFPLFENYYLGYLSIVDFDLYEIVQYVKILFPTKVESIKKLIELQRRVGNLPRVKAYLHSKKGREFCFLPIQMIKKFKNEVNQQQSMNS